MIDLRAPWRLPEWGLLGLERRSVSEVTNSQQEALAYVQQGSLRGFAQCDAGQTRCRRKPVRAHVISRVQLTHVTDRGHGVRIVSRPSLSFILLLPSGATAAHMGTAVSVRPPVSRFLGSVSDPCFGLADSRRSPALAPATPLRPVTALFAAFIATMPVSDFFAPYIIGLRHHAFPMRSHRLPDRTTRRPPRSRRGVYVRAWGLRRRDVRLRLAIAAHPILPSTMRRASAHTPW